MKEQCLEFMRLMFPEGVNDAHQHRDVIRIFYAGWVEALRANRSVHAVVWALDLYKAIADENWWPDDSWKWW